MGDAVLEKCLCTYSAHEMRRLASDLYFFDIREKVGERRRRRRKGRRDKLLS